MRKSSSRQTPSLSLVIQPKISMMADRYNLYLAQKIKIKQKQKFINQIFKFQCFSIVQSFWLKLIPIKIRGVMNQYQLFLECLRKNKEINSKKVILQQSEEIVKTKKPLKFSEKNIENNLKEQKKVIGITYSKQNITILLDFLSQQLIKKLFQKYQICPLCIQGQIYQKQYDSKLVSRRQSILIFWKGLFDQLIVLKQIPLYLKQEYSVDETQNLLYRQIKQTFIQRQNYQNQIKQTAAIKRGQQIKSTTDFATTHKLTLSTNDRQQVIQ